MNEAAGKRDFLCVVHLPEPVPFAYTQNRVRFTADKAQGEVLYRGDLRQAVCVEPGLKNRLPGMFDGEKELSPERCAEVFEALQDANPVRRVDRSRANRITVEVKVGTPAMLVLTECYHPGWKVTVNGTPATLWRVNYLQQGLWLTPRSETQTVELRFFPKAVGYGLAISGGSLGIIAAVAAGALLVNRRKPQARGKQGE